MPGAHTQKCSGSPRLRLGRGHSPECSGLENRGRPSGAGDGGLRTPPAPGPAQAKDCRNLPGRRFRPGHVNELVAAMTFGVMAHVVLADLPMQNLEGPVFGSQVGSYPLHDLDKVQSCRENASRCCLDAPFRVTLYQTQCEALEISNAEDRIAPLCE